MDIHKVVIHIDPKDKFNKIEVLNLLEQVIGSETRSWLAVLIRYQSAPEFTCRDDGEVLSWAASSHLSSINKDVPLFEIISKLLLNLDILLFAVQVGRPMGSYQSKSNGKPESKLATVAWVIPHLGEPNLLRTCLAGIDFQTIKSYEVNVTLDEPASEAISLIAKDFPWATIQELSETGIGPYPGRQFAIENTKQPLILFQDSDDVPASNRVACELKHLLDTKADGTGCHELRIDYIERKVFAIRFPLDVSNAFNLNCGHPLFFPTMLIKRSSFFRAGGLSTNIHFGLDTQFILRANFVCKFVNVDEFLYFRRKRQNSLTTAPATALGTPVRKGLAQMWKLDFAAIKNNRLSVQNSSLKVFNYPKMNMLKCRILSSNTSLD
jgi:hypothetical protein